jgi:hypothetical protein
LIINKTYDIPYVLILQIFTNIKIKLIVKIQVKNYSRIDQTKYETCKIVKNISKTPIDNKLYIYETY